MYIDMTNGNGNQKTLIHQMKKRNDHLKNFKLSGKQRMPYFLNYSKNYFFVHYYLYNKIKKAFIQLKLI